MRVATIGRRVARPARRFDYGVAAVCIGCIKVVGKAWEMTVSVGEEPEPSTERSTERCTERCTEQESRRWSELQPHALGPTVAFWRFDD